MKNVQGTHPYYLHPFIRQILPALKHRIFLDCGCGKGTYGYLMRMDKNGNMGYMIGIDISKFNLRICKIHKVYDDVIQGDVSLLPFKNKAIDVTLASEVIEHFPKKAGINFLNEVERVTKDMSILTTPNRLIRGVGHKSLWTAKEFKQRGYKVHGVGFKWPPLNLYLRSLVLFLLTPISYVLPQLSGHLLAKKEFSSKLNSERSI